MKQPAVVRRAAYAAACALLFPLSGAASFAQSVIATIPAQEGSLGVPLSIAVNPLTQLVYIAGNGVEVVNQRTNTPVTTLDIGENNESGIAINPVSRMLYVTDYFTGMYVFDLKTNTVVSTLPLFVARGVAYNPLTNRVYTLDNHGCTDSRDRDRRFASLYDYDQPGHESHLPPGADGTGPAGRRGRRHECGHDRAASGQSAL
jgi:hypothetical protein